MPRYAIEKADLQRAALNTQLGDGIAQRFLGLQVDAFIDEGEDWAEGQVSHFLATPLKPTRAPGVARGTPLPSPLTKANYPREFILAATYYALALLMYSEYFENEPNASQAGAWAEERAVNYIMEFRSRPTVRVGGGRRRHPNVHMPPSIYPMEDHERQGGGI